MAVQPAPAERARARKAKTEERTDAQVGALRETARDMARQPQQSGYYDREGNPIARKNPNYRNSHDFDKSEVPEGYAYQWIRLSVYGDPDTSEYFEMHENGWRPVPHERHKNRFAPTFHEGKACIVRKGQLLMERPIGLNIEAMAQQQRDANAQIGDQFKRFSVPLPDNVRAMGLDGRGSIARKTDDVGQVRSEFMPKRELAIDQ